jgi:hypothetical protein
MGNSSEQYNTSQEFFFFQIPASSLWDARTAPSLTTNSSSAQYMVCTESDMHIEK